MFDYEFRDLVSKYVKMSNSLVNIILLLYVISNNIILSDKNVHAKDICISVFFTLIH